MRQNRGFTLIELMITVAIVGILGGIAYPSYQAYVKRAYRADARAQILDMAQKQERYYSSNNTYLAIAAPTTAAPAGWQNWAGGGTMTGRKYDISVTLGAGGTSYTITAAPSNGFTDTSCGTYTMTSANVRGNTGNSMTSADCWSK
ncbi:MAG: type IV pilin protein [Betaproteobacteria bacterium]|nr:type IV pilin protein [Betaproteobacteria bacterium]